MTTSAQKRILSNSIGIAIAIGVCVLPFLSNGVFFASGQFTLDIVLGAILTTLTTVFLTSQRFRRTLLEKEHLHIGDFAMIGLVLLYLIALFYSASLNLSVEGALNYVVMLLPYFVFRFRAIRTAISPWIGIGFVVASVVLDFIGIANGWGQLHFPSATETTPQGQIQIASVFQYHNAFAAFTASIALGLLVWSSRTGSGWLKQGLAISISGLNILSLLSSGSRGALAIWAVLMIFTAIGMRETAENQPLARNRFLVNSYISLFGGLIGYELTNHAIIRHRPYDGWLGIMLSIVIPYVLVVLSRLTLKTYTRIRPRNGLWYLIGIGVLIAIAGAAVKHHAITQKLASYQVHQLSVSQRFIFWGDGLKILFGNPVSGRGSGAWQAMYTSVQSYPYYSNKSHSFGVDTLIEVGILGAMCMISLVWPLFRQMIWPRKDSLANMQPVQWAFIAGSWMLFAHSLMDWDMSFEYLLLLFFAGVGAASAEGPVVKVEAYRLGSTRTWFAVGVGVFAVVTTLVSIGGVVSIKIANIAERQQPFVASHTLLTAYHFAPYDGDYLAQAANALLRSGASLSNQQTAERWIKVAERLDPYSSSNAASYAQLAYNLGNYKVAFSQAQLAVNNAPYWPANMSLALTTGTVAGLEEAVNDPSYSRNTFENVVTMYRTAQNYRRVVKALPSYLPPSVPYTLNTFSLVSVAAAEYALGNVEGAESLAANEVNDPSQHTRQTAEMIVLMVKSPTKVGNYVKFHPGVNTSYQLLERAAQVLR